MAELPKLDRPVFIICQHRTGSTMLKNLLDAHPDLAMISEEMDVSNPWRRGLDWHEKKFRKERERLFATLYEGKLHGTFFQKKQLDFYGIVKNDLMADDKNLPVGWQRLFDNILRRCLHNLGKPRIGVKFPLHWSRLDSLRDIYPDSLIIFLTRDPRAMICSKLRHEATLRRRNFFGFLIHYFTLGFFVVECWWLTATMNKWLPMKDVTHVRYEDLVSDSSNEMRRVFSFLQLDPGRFDEINFGKVSGQPSSNLKALVFGISRSLNEAWRDELNRFDIALITFSLRRMMRRFGYT